MFFLGKCLPDRTLFPACSRCQEISREAEAKLSLVITPFELPDIDRQAYVRRVADVRRRFPGLIDEMLPTPQQRYKILQEVGRSDLISTETEVVLLPVDQWSTMFGILSKKLILALHYQLFQRPLPSLGGIQHSLVPAPHLDQDFDDQFLRVTPNLELPFHGSQNLQSQMSIRWGGDVNLKMGIFRVRLHESVIVYGMTIGNPDQTGLAENWETPLA